MHTKILKIHYPSAETDTIGAVSASVREQVLELFKSNRVSFSFSVNKSSGYIMVYPTAPILSIRISTHESDGSVPADSLFIESDDGRTTVINAEAEGGQRVSEAMLTEALNAAQLTSADIKKIINDFDI